MQSLLNPVEVLAQVLKTTVRLAERSSLDRQGNSMHIASGRRIACGNMHVVAYSQEEYARWNEGVSDVMGCLGIEISKDFTVNGMEYGRNGWYESLSRDNVTSNAMKNMLENTIAEK